MTKKDFELIARVLSYTASINDTDSEASRVARCTVTHIANRFADELAKTSPRFERKRFFAACTPTTKGQAL